MTRQEAQQRIQKHIRRVGNRPVIVTERKIRYWWGICNYALFCGKLCPPRQIAIRRFRNNLLGFCEASSTDERVVIGISSAITTRRMFLTVLVHEMVHQWEHETYKRMGHGKRFFQWQRRINQRLGLDLVTEIDEEDYFTHGERQLYKRRHSSPQ